MSNVTPPADLMALSPCPWCPDGVSLTSNGDENYYVECHGCGASGPAQDTGAEAIAAWNARPSLSAQAVGWIYEDELPDGYPYDAMFPYSKVDGVRMFPVFAPEHAFRAGYQSGYSAGCDRPNGYAREADISNEWSEYAKENCNA